MKKVPLHMKIFIGLFLGIVVGLIFGPKARSIEFIGTIFIRLITMLVVPLIFFSLSLGTASLGDIKKLGRIGLKTIIYFTLTTAIAIVIGLVAANLLKPGTGLNEQVKQDLLKNYQQSAENQTSIIEQKPSLISVLVNIVPTNPIKAMAEGEMLQVIFIALLFGICLTLINSEKSRQLLQLFDGANEAILQAINLVMKFAPYGVLALLASIIGQFGAGILLTLLKYILVVILGLSVHAIVVDGLLVRYLGKMKPAQFFKHTTDAMLIAFSTSSSNATIPVALECMDKLKVKREYSSFVIPLGATINMDGTALYQGVAAVFIAQIYGINLTLGAQATIVLMALLASIGTAGVPGAGMIMLAMVLKQVNIPLEGVALILGVDRIIDMCRTTVNMIGNMAASIFIHSSEEKANFIKQS
ncbi:MAG TPA: dicarboxylate/amino acid:cation symporter [Candidatus Saccharicenans sp.]|nr:dicarboxylate/amino acid:cation symporter [Candidatus Saccharicenans sp.]HOL46316.1 dicarboxylate/amino acid:cation symporter [Candidatus Saccharicenans sp.]HPP24673.1 dicarboxylate/amino acid:cation symporter [Candidatus Saccharicenans sp.]